MGGGNLVETVVSRLQTVSNYAVIGSNAVAIHLARAEDLKLPLEIIAAEDPQIQDLVASRTSPLESLFPEAILSAAEEKPISYAGTRYHLRIAKPEHLIAIDLALRGRIAADAFELIRAKMMTNSEEVRCLLKVRPNYDELYGVLTQAIYEFR